MSGRLIYYLKRLGIFLVTVALIVGVTGCFGAPTQPPPESEWTDIYDWIDLNKIRNNLSGSYRLMNPLSSSTTGYPEVASEIANKGEGWISIGNAFGPFTGWFDGQGNEISDLYIKCPEQDHVGLFGYAGRSGVIKNIGVVNVDVTGKNYVGGLVGRNDGTVTIDSYSSGTVAGERAVGGLVGWNAFGTVTSNSYSECSVTGTSSVGGLVGYNEGTVSNSYFTGSVNGEEYVGGLAGHNRIGGAVSGSRSSGSVTGNKYVGGLVGHNIEGTVSGSSSTGSVTGTSSVGGLVGHNENTSITNSYSTGSVTGTSTVGGLVGCNVGGTISKSHFSGIVTGADYVGGLVGHSSGGSVSNSYATSSVTGTSTIVGGLVGCNDAGSIVSTSYSTGSVTGTSTIGGLVGHNEGTVSTSYSTGGVAGTSPVGGLVGHNEGTVSNSLWDKETSGMDMSEGGTGKTTAEMKDLATFTAVTEGLDTPWKMLPVASGQTNSDYTWNIVNGQNYPFLSENPPK